MKRGYFFHEKIKAVFGSVDSYVECHADELDLVEFEVTDHRGVTFDKLTELSKILHTRKIDLNGGEHEGCPTCGGERFVHIRCDEVVFPGTMTEKEKKKRALP